MEDTQPEIVETDSETSCRSPTPGSPKKTVCFDTVSIREFNLMMGDHPEVFEGPPLALDWQLLGTYSLTVDEHERPHHRSKTELRIPAEQREAKLNQEYSKKEIFKQLQQCLRVRNERFASLSNVHTESIEQAWQSILKKVKKVVTPKNEPVPAKEWLKQNKPERRRASESIAILTRNTEANTTKPRARSFTDHTYVDESV